MAYNSLITRTDAEALIPEDVSAEIIQGVPQKSGVLTLGRRLPNMSRKQLRMPVLAALANAYFVSGATGASAPGLKQTTEIAWANKYINAEEIACIVPIPEEVLDDTDYDIWGEVKPRIIEAFGKVIDAAVFWGTNAPASWPTCILTAAIAAGNAVALGAKGDLYDDVLGDGGIFSLVEADGYMVTGNVAGPTFKGKLRGVRDSNGNPIFKSVAVQDATRYELDGTPIEFNMNGAWDVSKAHDISGDFSQLVYSFRQDITYKVLTEAVIQDASGNIIYNLAQQDMVALRAVLRFGWQLPNPINAVQPTEASRYPFGVLLPEA